MIADHKSLEKLSSCIGAPTPRMQRWLLKIQPYDYTIQYEPGHKNTSNILSRSPLQYETTNDDTEQINSITNDARSCAVSIDKTK